MITKIQLQSIISKYFLNGLTREDTKWEINNKKLKIKFMSQTMDMLGELNFDNFPLEDANVGIFNTTQLNKLISITHGDLLLNLTKSNKLPTKLNISDSQFNVNYSLADIMMVKKVADIEEPSEYHSEIVLEQEHVTALIKSKTALGDDNNVLIESSITPNGDASILFTFGENIEHSHKVSYMIQSNNNSNIKLNFPSDILKEILVANKDMDEGKILINNEGIMKLKFSDKKNLNTEYFLICKNEE